MAWTLFFDFEAIKIHDFDKKFFAVFVDYFVCYVVAVLWAADNRFHEHLFCNMSMPSFHVCCRVIENAILYGIVLLFISFGNDNNGIDVFENNYTYWYFWITTVTLVLEPLLFIMIKNDAQQNIFEK